VRGRPARMRAGGARTAQARRGSPKTSPCESAHLRVAPGARASRPHARRRRAHRARGAFLAEMRGHSHAHLPPPPSCPCSHMGNAPRGACAVRRRRKTHTLCGVSAQATPPAALTPGASSAGNATVGAPPDGDDTGAAIPARRGAASSTVARMGTPVPSTQQAGMTGGAAQRSPHGFAQGRMVYA